MRPMSRGLQLAGSDCPKRKCGRRISVNMATLVSGKRGKTRTICQLNSLSILYPVVVLYCLSVLPVEAKQDNLRVITDGNWEEILTGEWMIEFYAPWCPACQQLQPVWNEFADWSEDLGVNMAKVDVTEQPGLSGRFIITALPTIYHCKDGVFRRYQGARTKEDFLSFIDEKKWQNIEPISSWFGPSSFMMNMMSALFKLSMFIRQCHTYLTEQVGIPVWGSYIIFGLVTLFSGLTLGLVLVFFADYVFPSRRFSSAYCQKKHAMEQARLRQQLEEEQEADGEEEEDEDEYAGSAEEWSIEGAKEDIVRRRAVGGGEEEDT
ncbi:thioredoxin-related transmembrane protein 1 [Neoarius graeffei]|uniref:thioredoxin-related transmembrane protein 1 n=1 Tax=Neoarius graeffei TaxID=443677 RepID=UPI00298C0C99|nr:thioredoxin-related transmembrane protein 1 [Neoarius graeffei]